jgi:secreted trypsin-like serine protease
MGLVGPNYRRMSLRAGALLSAALLSSGGIAQAQSNGTESDDGVYMRNELPDHFDLENGATGYRIVGGTMARPGAWPSMVGLYNRGSFGGNSPICGAAIIDSQWALTAGHCVYQRSADGYFIREGTSQSGGGRMIEVRQIVIHENYRHRPVPLNDVALLRLASAAQAPRQTLMRNTLRPQLLSNGKLSTVVGYGTVRPGGQVSQHLLQVDIPVVSRERCASQYAASDITEATMCAGLEEGGKDSCQGDSGGPIYVKDRMNQAIQAGVVSWGEGCAQPKKYGVYASIGYFEDWVRRHVPNASFAAAATGQTQGSASAGNQGLESYVGNVPAGASSQTAQVNVDVLPGERVKVGERITVRVTSSVAGHLFVFNQDHEGKAFQIFPNRFTGRELPGQTRAQVEAGKLTTVPGPMDGFALRVTPPTGRNRLLAVIVPSEVRVDDLVQKNESMQPIDNFDELISTITTRERSVRGIAVEEAVPKKRAVGTREYEIVQ